MTDPTDFGNGGSRREQPDDDDDGETMPDLDEWQTIPETGFDDIVGLTDEVQRLRETVVASMQSGRSVRTNTVFLYGQGDAGVTDLADGLAHALGEDGFSVYEVPLDDDVHRDVACPLAQYIKQARDREPCVLQVNRIGHADVGSGTATRAAIERLDADAPRVVVVATSTLWNDQRRDIHETGFTDWLDVCLHIDRPDAARRRAIVRRTLEELCAEHEIDFDAAAIEFEDALQEVRASRGYVLETVAKRAIVRVEAAGERECRTEHLAAAASHVAEEWNCQAGGHDQGRSGGRVEEAVDGSVSPSVPEVGFADVGGLDDVIQRVREVLLYPREFEAVFERAGVSPARGLLLHGPPGTGKTLLAKAVANASDRTFLAVQGPELKSMWYGQTEAQLREVFRVADEHAPSVVFFDELDAIAGTRSEFHNQVNESVVATLLAELDGLEERGDVLFLAATNRPEALDPAVTRAGRFGETVEVGLPDQEGRREIFAVHVSGLPTAGGVTPAWCSEQVPAGVSGAEIASICERSLYTAINDATESDEEIMVARRHMLAAIDEVVDADDEEDGAPRGFV